MANDTTTTDSGDSDLRLPSTRQDQIADENKSTSPTYPDRGPGDPGTTGAADSGQSSTTPSGGIGTGGREGG